MGPLPIAPSKKKLLIVGTNYFYKQIGVEPLARTQEGIIRNFIWRNIICKFSLPHELVTDNGQQFTAQDLVSFCQELNIKLPHSTPYKPQANDQAKSSNKTLINILRKKSRVKGKWVDKLPGVFWATKTTLITAIGENLFSLVYGTEVVIPSEIQEPTLLSELSQEDKDEFRKNIYSYQRGEERTP